MHRAGQFGGRILRRCWGLGQGKRKREKGKRKDEAFVAGLAFAFCLLPFTFAAGGRWGAISTAADDWPTYQHDAERSGITSERVPLPLVPCWVFQPRHAPEPAWGPPKSGPVEGILELPRNRFDDAPQVAVGSGRLYFGSSVDGKVYCLDASTGRVLWTRFTGGPVRLAPMVREGRVYAGSDDGYGYCLDARTGQLVWQFRQPRKTNGSLAAGG